MRSSVIVLFTIALAALCATEEITLNWDEPSYLHTRINVGDTVTWITQEGGPHTITSTDTSKELDSGILTDYPLHSFSHTFNKPGLYHYTSKANTQDMLGTIVVTQSDLSGGVHIFSGLLMAAISAALLVFVIS